MDLINFMRASTAPDWLVGAFMVYAGWVIILTRNVKLKLDPRINFFTGVTWVLQGLMYGILLQFLITDDSIRVFYSRLSFILICVAQSLPLTIEFIRSKRNGVSKRPTSNNSNGN